MYRTGSTSSHKVDIYLAHLPAGTADTRWLDGPQSEPVLDR
ncbi:hypothetical protein [Modestobacter roseus]|nr:hypothetical protein [Modestobacter roseus]